MSCFSEYFWFNCCDTQSSWLCTCRTSGSISV